MTTGPAADAAADASKIEPEFGEGLEETLALLDHNTLAGMRGLYRDLSAEIERRRQAEDKIAERLKDLGQELKRVLPTLRTEIDQEDVLAEFLNMVTPGMKGLDLHRGATAVDAAMCLQRLRDEYEKYTHGVTEPSASALAQFGRGGGA
jgi:ABC-type transporter Mla subunit MlaD